MSMVTMFMYYEPMAYGQFFSATADFHFRDLDITPSMPPRVKVEVDCNTPPVAIFIVAFLNNYYMSISHLWVAADDVHMRNH